MTWLMKHKDKKKFSQTIYYKIVCCTAKLTSNLKQYYRSLKTPKTLGKAIYMYHTDTD